MRTAFNWVPDVEWSAWYLADANGLFAAQGRHDAEFVHGGPNTPAVAQVLAAGDADIGVASDELQLIQANEEGADFVILGAMYQRSPSGLCWLADTPIATRRGPRRQAARPDHRRRDPRRRALQDQRPRARLRDGADELRPAAAHRRRRRRHHVLRHEPADPARSCRASRPSRCRTPTSGSRRSATCCSRRKEYVEANRDLLVAYFAGLIAGVEANVADPKAVIPLLTDDYGKDAEIDLAYTEAGNPAYIALLDSDYTEANGLLMIDPAYLEGEVYPSYEAAGETDLPPVVRAARRDGDGRRPRSCT